jgi:glycerophosphoryl diester phosphodiesterase
MVKFGRHLQFFLECEPPKDSKETLYIVPYNQLRDSIVQHYDDDDDDNDAQDSQPFPNESLESFNESKSRNSNNTTHPFETIWKQELQKANMEFTKATQTCWSIVFDSIQHIPHARGANLETALRIYTPKEGTEASQDLLSFLKRIQSVAELNTEGLRKLVKKMDKQLQKEHDTDTKGGGNGGRNGGNGNTEKGNKRYDTNYSTRLLPELYSSNMYIGQPTLEMAIDALRDMLEDDEEYEGYEGYEEYEEATGAANGHGEHVLYRMEQENGGNDIKYAMVRRGTTTNGYNPIIGRRRRNNKDESPDSLEEEMIVSRRADEMLWLREMITLMPQEHMEHVVAHRGFHYPEKSQRTDSRPLENSLFAFEAAWSHGISLCECDVALTKDEKLVLAHDNDFTRLALNPSSNVSRTKVSDLTYKQLIALTLKNGVRAPLLFDVLRSAHEIGEHAKLIIEIKPGNNQASMALARLLARHPMLMNHVAAIMSFDLWSMHELKRMLCKMFSSGPSTSEMNQVGSSLHVDQLGSSPPHKLPSRHSSLALPMDINKFQIPKVILLTVADPPVNNFELWVDVNDYSPIDSWMFTNDSVLDGVYVKYQDEMLDSDGAESLRALCEKTTVGVWGKYGIDPDDYETLKYLVSCGVSYFNTDLPRHFLESKQSRYIRSTIG